MSEKMLKNAKKIIVLSVILLLFCGCPFACADDQVTNSKAFESASNYYRSGCQKLENSDLQGALEDFNKSLNYVQSPQDFLNRGYVKAEMGDYDGAIRDYTNCIEVANGSEEVQAEAFYNRAISYKDKKDYISALNDYNMAIRLNSTNADYYAQRAALKANMEGRIQEAKNDIEKARNLEPENKNFQKLGYAINDALAQQAQHTPVPTAKLPDFNTTDRNTENTVPRQRQTIVPVSSGAVSVQSVYSPSKPSTVNSITSTSDYGMLADEYMKSADYRTAVDYYTKAIELNPFSLDNAKFYYKRGVCKKSLRDFSGAQKDYEKAVLLNPELKNTIGLP